MKSIRSLLLSASLALSLALLGPACATVPSGVNTDNMRVAHSDCGVSRKIANTIPRLEGIVPSPGSILLQPHQVPKDMIGYLPYDDCLIIKPGVEPQVTLNRPSIEVYHLRLSPDTVPQASGSTRLYLLQRIDPDHWND